MFKTSEIVGSGEIRFKLVSLSRIYKLSLTAIGLISTTAFIKTNSDVNLYEGILLRFNKRRQTRSKKNSNGNWLHLHLKFLFIENYIRFIILF